MLEKQPCPADFPSGMLARLKLRYALVQLPVTGSVNVYETLPCVYHDMSAGVLFPLQLASSPDVKQILHMCGTVILFHDSRSNRENICLSCLQS